MNDTNKNRVKKLLLSANNELHDWTLGFHQHRPIKFVNEAFTALESGDDLNVMIAIDLAIANLRGKGYPYELLQTAATIVEHQLEKEKR